MPHPSTMLKSTWILNSQTTAKIIMTRYSLILILCLGFIPGRTSFGQTDTAATMEYDFLIEGNRRLFLRDANKITVWPQTKDSVVQMTRI